MGGREELEALRGRIESVVLGLPTAASAAGEFARLRALRRLDDFVLPRVDSLDAPLVAVIGGSTGGGKSTLVNALVGARVSSSSPVRPTTRRPLLVHRASDAPWFDSQRILPGLARIRVAPDAPPTPAGAGGTKEVELRASQSLPEGLALIDSPDIDSVSAENRAFSRQLLDAADLWIFVTTAARYADAVPWELLDEAAASGLVLAVVLNRVPPEAREPVEADLRALMNSRGLAAAPIIAIEEQRLVEGELPSAAVEPLAQWLAGLASDAESRREVARQALSGAVADVAQAAGLVADAIDEGEAERSRASLVVDALESDALERLGDATADGSLLRGEVLARWQDVVGAADFTRSLTRTVSQIRDRLTAWVTGRPAPIAPVEDALEAGLASLVLAELLRVGDEVVEHWGRAESTRLVARRAAPPSTEEAQTRALDLTREWQAALLALVRSEGQSKRSTARIAAVGVNVVSVALIIAVFASTGGLTGAEVGIAGASAVVAQKLLETIFGEQAVRTMAKTARDDLMHRMKEALDETVAPLRAALPEPASGEELREAAKEAARSWRSR